jgi:tetratricopeptide (TPR) repeat protein
MANWDGEIAPFRDDSFNETVESAADAGRILGAKLAITTESLDESSVALSLVSPENLDTLEKEIVVLPPNDPVESRNLIALTMLQLLGVKTDQFTPPESPAERVSPGAVDYYTQALGLLQQRNSAESVKAAIMLLERSTQESPDFAPAYAELGRAYLYRYEEIRDVNLLDDAERFCNRALELDENIETVFLTLGRIKVEKGQYGLANREFSRALQKDSTNTEALLGLANVLWKQRRISEAEAMFREAISTRKSYWPGYRQLALFYFNENRLEEAIEQFKIVAELAPFNPVGFRGIGACYFLLYEFELAKEYFQKALAIADDYTLYSNMGAVEFYLGNFSDAAHWFEKSLATDSTDYLVWGNLAMAYEYIPGEQARLRETALKTLEMTEALLKVNPDDDFVKARLAGIHLQLGDTSSAMTLLGNYTGAPDPDLSAGTVFELATAWEAVGDRDRAFQWLAEALERDYPQTELLYYPGFSELREDPRFLDLIGSFPSDKEEPG